MPVSISMPDVIVEIAFTTDPGDPAPSWTDVSAYVEAAGDGGPISITRGRSDELSEIQPSVLSLTLDNRDGRFTAGYTGGAYYPNVKLGRRIRVTETWSATTYYRFDGYINEWPTVWPDGTHVKSTVTITASSRMSTLGNRRPLKSIIEQEYLLDSPVLYYLLNEPQGASTASSCMPSTYVTKLSSGGAGTAFTFGDATGPTTDGYTALDVNGGTYLKRQFSEDFISLGQSDFSLEVAFATTATSVSMMQIATDNDGGPDFTNISIGGGSNNKVVVSGAWGNDTFSIASAVAVNDGEAHLVSVTADDIGATVTVTAYLDGAAFGSAAVATDSGTSTIPRFSWMSVGNLATGGTAFNGSLAHLAIFDTTLSAGRIADHAEAVLTGFAGELSSDRIERLATYLDIDPTFWDFDTGVAVVDNQFTEGASAIDLMQAVARTEFGLLFDGGDGTLVFQNRDYRAGPLGSLVTAALTVTGGEIEGGVTFKLDNQGIANDVTVRSGDDSVRVIDEASIDAYGVYDRQVDLLTTTDEELQDAANYALSRYSTPVVRSPQMSVSVNTLSTSAQITDVLTLDLSKRISVSGLPSQAPASSLEFFVEGYSEQIGAESYVITFNLSPSALSDVWLLNSATHSQLDSTTILGL
jgi:hypothetical protein